MKSGLHRATSAILWILLVFTVLGTLSVLCRNEEKNYDNNENEEKWRDVHAFRRTQNSENLDMTNEE